MEGIRVGQHGCGPLPDLLNGDLLFPSDAQNPPTSGVEPGVNLADAGLTCVEVLGACHRKELNFFFATTFWIVFG